MITKTKWSNRINIGDLHESYQSGEITIDEVASKFADRLKSYRDKTFADDTHEYHDLTDFINWLKKDVQGDVETYDDILRDIYNWADYNKRLWIDCNP